ncbi:MAG: RNA polymerase sigma factor [bacterium]|nr:RNA polymerase sigma factor [bacterium]
MGKFEINPAESQLVARLRQGQSRAVEQWYHLYQKRLLRLVQARLPSIQDAQDVTQEIFINCLQNLSNFSEQSSLWTWMCSIAKHEIADYYRKLYAKKVLQLLPLSDFLPVNNLHSSTELAEKLECVWQKIGGYYRELLMQKYLDQKKVAQLARAQGKTEKAIESELFRARQAFKEAFNELED